MKTKIHHYLLFAVIILLHLVWLYTIREQITPELVFPVWLVKNARTFVSEIHTMYPLGLFYLVSLVYSLTENLRVSIYLVMFALISLLDGILFFYLRDRFKFRFVAFGLVFYILWQVFARGNYLWFDLATIPFVALSFFSFEKYVKSKDKKYLLKASLILALGNFFKNTT